MTHRRALLALAGTAGLATLLPSLSGAQTVDAGSAANQWFPLRGDTGQPVPNTRAPVELVEEIEDLPGALWSGPTSASVKLVEFYDYNCPWCRAAEGARDALMKADPDLRVGIVNNPILSVGSAQAAKVDLALLTLKGPAASIALHRRLFAAKGRIDGLTALEAVAALGFDRAAVENAADSDPVRAMLSRQVRLAASLGLVATPSYVVGGAALLGYPGPETLRRVVDSTRRCGTIAC